MTPRDSAERRQSPWPTMTPSVSCGVAKVCACRHFDTCQRVVTACRHLSRVSSPSDGSVLSAAPLHTPISCPSGLVAAHHGGRAPGRVQRGHGNCASISCGHRLGALPGQGTGPFHRLHWYHLDVSGTIKEASGLCPERSVVGDDRGYRPLPSVSRQVTRGHVS